MSWLPEGKSAAVCLSVDDVHPAGGAEHALDHVRWLQQRHPHLHVTLFTTPDWRSLAPYASASWRSRMPVIRRLAFHVPVHRAGTLALKRHQGFCRYLREWDGVELAVHGLHHVQRGPNPLLELSGRSRRGSQAILRHALRHFEEADLPVARGLSPPGWAASPALVSAMEALAFTFLASARDLDTPVRSDAVTAGSGLRRVSLIRPQRIQGTRVVHLTTNYQATSTHTRALQIVAAGGLVSIKAHLLESLGSYRALDGLNAKYRDHLHDLLRRLEDEAGDALWWPLMSEAAARA